MVNAILVALGKQIFHGHREYFYTIDPDFTRIAFLLGLPWADVQNGRKANAPSPAECVAYGRHPMDAWNEQDSFYPYRNEILDKRGRISDPVQLAAFFASRNDLESANRMLQFRQLRIAAGSVGHQASVRQNYILPFDFEDLGLARIEFATGHDSLFCPGAFVLSWKSEYVECLKRNFSMYMYHYLGKIEEVSGANLRQYIAAEAYAAAKGWMGPRTANYRNAYTAVQFVQDPEQVRSLTGVNPLFALLHPKASSAAYLAGLRKLVQVAASTRRDILCRMHRAPTLEELDKIRSYKLIDVLLEMPWSLMEPLAADGSLQRMMLAWLGSVHPDVMRNAIKDHPKRATLENPDRWYETNPYGWVDVMKKLERFRTASIEVRRKLDELTGSPWISFLALLESFERSTEHIREALGAHSNADKIFAAVSEYQPKIMARDIEGLSSAGD